MEYAFNFRASQFPVDNFVFCQKWGRIFVTLLFIRRNGNRNDRVCIMFMNEKLFRFQNHQKKVYNIQDRFQCLHFYWNLRHTRVTRHGGGRVTLYFATWSGVQTTIRPCQGKRKQVTCNKFWEKPLFVWLLRYKKGSNCNRKPVPTIGQSGVENFFPRFLLVIITYFYVWRQLLLLLSVFALAFSMEKGSNYQLLPFTSLYAYGKKEAITSYACVHHYTWARGYVKSVKII